MGDVAKIICVGGSFEINISLGLTEKQYSFLNIDYDKIKDLSELKPYFNNNENFNKDDSNHNFSVLSLLSISSTNSLFNNLLFINRANKVKSFIEYIIPFLPKYELEYEFMENIVKIICEKNYIFIEYYNLLDIKPNITFSFKKIDENGQVADAKNFILSKENKFSETNEEYNGDLFKGFNFEFDCTFFYSSITELIKCKLKSNKEIEDFILNIYNKYPKMIICINYLSYSKDENKIDLSTINLITELLGLTDIFIFEKNEVSEYFNIIQSLEDEEKKNKITLQLSYKKRRSNSQDICLDENYKLNSNRCTKILQNKIPIEYSFIQKIKSKKNSLIRIAIFFDNLEKIIIIHQDVMTGLVLFHNKFYLNFYPNNIQEEEIEDYKNVFSSHFKIINSIFLGGFLSRLFNNKSFKTSIIAGNESVKKVIDLIKYDIDFPNNNEFYEILVKRTTPIKSKEEIENLKKEKNFILDCTNLLTNKKKEYNALYDISCLSYFSNYENRKILFKQGFINKKGYILGEPENNAFSNLVKNKKIIKNYSNERGILKKAKDNNNYLKAQLRNLCLSKPEDIQKSNIIDSMGIINKYNQNLIHKNKLPSLERKNKNTFISNNELYFKELRKSKLIKFKKISNGQILSRINKLKHLNSSYNSISKNIDNGNNSIPQSNFSLRHRNSNIINTPFKNHSVDKNINSYIKKIEIDDKNFNHNQNKLNDIEKDIKKGNNDTNNEQNISDNEEIRSKKEKSNSLKTIKGKGYMSQNAFKKILQEYENKIMNSSNSSPIKKNYSNPYSSYSKKE